MHTQRDLFGLLPGVAGGRARRDLYGTDDLATIGAAGGRSTLKRYGASYMAAIGERGRAARRRKRETTPTTLYHPDGTPIYRRIPYWPRPGTSDYSPRRRRPFMVLIELEEPQP